MSIVSIFSGSFSTAEAVVAELAAKTGFTVISDEKVIAKAAAESAFSRAQLERAVYGKPSVFNKFSRDRERAVAILQAILAEHLTTCDKCIFTGYLGLLIPKEITHVLRCLIIADSSFRKERAAASERISAEAAAKRIKKDDESAFRWVDFLHGTTPWDAGLYDIVIPMENSEVSQTVALIAENLQKDVVQRTDASHHAAEDFMLKAEVAKALVDAGHDVGVTVTGGEVTLTINHNVLMLAKLENDLRSLVSGFPGVTTVTTTVAEKSTQADLYRQHDANLPSRVLLVDDETEFVQVLSERLQSRELGSHVVHTGQEAINVFDDEAPEVMVVDLKMPGIDGFEVLRQAKEKNPATEVIILTGQGSAKDKEECLRLGAFAYLEKPVDIELMANTMKEAYAKVRAR